MLEERAQVEKNRPRSMYRAEARTVNGIIFKFALGTGRCDPKAKQQKLEKVCYQLGQAQVCTTLRGTGDALAFPSSPVKL